MAASEGFRRITTLGRRTAITGALLLLFGLFTELCMSQLSNHQANNPAGLFLAPGTFLFIIGVLLLLAGWIGEGFVTSHEPDSHPRG